MDELGKQIIEGANMEVEKINIERKENCALAAKGLMSALKSLKFDTRFDEYHFASHSTTFFDSSNTFKLKDFQRCPQFKEFEESITKSDITLHIDMARCVSNCLLLKDTRVHIAHHSGIGLNGNFVVFTQQYRR